MVLIRKLIAWILGYLFESAIQSLVSAISALYLELFKIGFRIEQFLSTTKIPSQDPLIIICNTVYIYGTLLLTIKFLSRGFNTYILELEGDATDSPIDLVKRYGKAMFITLSMGGLYPILVDVASSFLDTALKGMDKAFNTQKFADAAVKSITTGTDMTKTLCYVTYAIVFLLICFNVLKNGFQLLILRIGTPFFVMGLLDSDNGIFNQWVKNMIRFPFTFLIQIMFLRYSFNFIFGAKIFDNIIAIAMLMVGLKLPSILQEYLLPTGNGGGASSKIMMVTQLSGLLKGAGK